jgi:glutathione S-transferase
MKLYVTPGSPYARLARIVVIEKQLESRVEIVFAKTRTAGSPYYAINPSGRVPYLVRDDGVGIEESALICAHLDHADGRPMLEWRAADAWEGRRLEALARSMCDGVSVWLRELYRPEHERSPGVIEHERQRSLRMAGLWEREIVHPLMSGALNMAQLMLACGLGVEARLPALDWRSGHPKLVQWFERFAARPSFVATAPPV